VAEHDCEEDLGHPFSVAVKGREYTVGRTGQDSEIPINGKYIFSCPGSISSRETMHDS
jgi:hypothetical protein